MKLRYPRCNLLNKSRNTEISSWGGSSSSTQTSRHLPGSSSSSTAEEENRIIQISTIVPLNQLSPQNHFWTGAGRWLSKEWSSVFSLGRGGDVAAWTCKQWAVQAPLKFSHFSLALATKRMPNYSFKLGATAWSTGLLIAPPENPIKNSATAGI